jgi:hypothetical protein
VKFLSLRGSFLVEGRGDIFEVKLFLGRGRGGGGPSETLGRIRFPRPKSVSLMYPFSCISKLSGLISRCRQWWECLCTRKETGMPI